ncbi:hypothetical protein BJY00DRAFT_301953 [Aspergillus carlsbadensis]|nr:hypothetical protein BJY00DRAFT_301953 [Aspergillus carlsbadensis]
MAPHEGLIHLKEYNIKDSNIKLIGSDLDHHVKYASAAIEPAWNNRKIGNFQVIPWPREWYGKFYAGNSLKTLQDKASIATYKTIKLNNKEFTLPFKQITIRAGGVASGFTHVEDKKTPKEITTLLRGFKHPAATGRLDSMIIYEVKPSWRLLDDNNVWQGQNCSLIEKAKAAQVVNKMTLAKHVDVEVLSRHEARSRVVVDLLGGGKEVDSISTIFAAPRLIGSGSRVKRAALESSGSATEPAPRKLFWLSDALGQLEFELLWVCQGLGASEREKALWLKVAQAYMQHMQSLEEELYMIPIMKVVQGYESPSFVKAVDF